MEVNLFMNKREKLEIYYIKKVEEFINEEMKLMISYFKLMKEYQNKDKNFFDKNRECVNGKQDLEK